MGARVAIDLTKAAYIRYAVLGCLGCLGCNPSHSQIHFFFGRERGALEPQSLLALRGLRHVVRMSNRDEQLRTLRVGLAPIPNPG
jgi:hypothetical protein